MPSKVARAPRRRRARERAARLDPGTRRALLLAAAMRVFAARGLLIARHAEIAAEAGVSVSAVFFYFPTRAALVDAVVAEVDGFYSALVADALADADHAPVPDVLLRLARAFAASVESHPDHARIWLDWSTAFGDDSWPRYRAFQERVVGLTAAAIASGQRAGTVDPDLEPEGEALLLMGAAYIVVQLQITRRPPAEVERFLRTLVRSTVGRMTTS
jgi:TetR/AcrR family hemagglutinin/protease transcriptional regulator